MGSLQSIYNWDYEESIELDNEQFGSPSDDNSSHSLETFIHILIY